MRGIGGDASLKTLAGRMSVHRIVNASYLIDNTTHRFELPLRVATE
jgi:hypothetical protein